MKIERRIFNAELRAVRATDQPTQLVGYASVFNQPSGDLGGFTEIIKPGAFTRTLAAGADVRALFNHDPNFIIGRTTDGGKTGTLRLSEDATGLKFVIDMPDTQVGRDLLVSVERGDITQNSFGFVVKEQTRSMVKGADGENRMVREIVDCDLFDCSPVTFPAYPQTTLEARSAFMFPNGLPEELTELMSEKTDDAALAALENVRRITAQLRMSLIRL